MWPPFPAGACDAHFHIFGDGYPTVAHATVRPVPTTIEGYLRFARTAGVSRSVIVQPSVYGTDNRCMLDALARLGPGTRGVAVVDDTVSDDTLATLHAAGVRGLRFNQVQVGATTMQMMRPLADRVAALGWHIQLHVRGHELTAHESMLSTLPVPLVLDHGGRIDVALGTADPGWAVVRRLVERGATWVKLSGPYIESASDAPRYGAATLLGSMLVQMAPERVLWGSDWPHATEPDKPSFDGLLNHFWGSVEDTSTAFQVLVRNPGVLYGFDVDDEL